MSRAPEMLKAVSTNVKPKVQVLKQSNVKKKKRSRKSTNVKNKTDLTKKSISQTFKDFPKPF